MKLVVDNPGLFRLGNLGIRALVIEKDARVGDSWRQRYEQARR
jgi:cation diffusion facilitator CzcD-associated flavoprotein CzcO